MWMDHPLKMRSESRKNLAEGECWQLAEGRMLKSPNLNITVDLLLNGCYVKDFEASEST